MMTGLERDVGRGDWRNAAVAANNLSSLHLLLGEVTEALQMGEASSQYADRTGEAFHRSTMRLAWADALHRAGELARAQKLFEGG
jgi:ATP/maltotriose-dependent transcriptional regulator MalT